MVVIDALVLLLVVPLLALAVGLALWFLVSRTEGPNCPAPCDGAPMVAFGVGLMILWLVWLLYWPVLIFWRRRTIGAQLLGMKFDGSGFRRYLVYGERNRP